MKLTLRLTGLDTLNLALCPLDIPGGLDGTLAIQARSHQGKDSIWPGMQILDGCTYHFYVDTSPPSWFHVTSMKHTDSRWMYSTYHFIWIHHSQVFSCDINETKAGLYLRGCVPPPCGDETHPRNNLLEQGGMPTSQ